ncbi:hypothetical protein AB0L53_13230 [Nonomuraea sp. NPDC052129]|uniref:hypothetical protein n=1 Tax=unclassified Nonomuraea TaxID=2593643 RepID=UPI0033D0191E
MHVTSSGKTTEITAPFTGEPLADLPVSGVDDVHEAYEKAQTVASQATWLGFEPPFGMTYDKWAGALVTTLKTMKRLRLK